LIRTLEEEDAKIEAELAGLSNDQEKHRLTVSILRFDEDLRRLERALKDKRARVRDIEERIGGDDD